VKEQIMAETSQREKEKPHQPRADDQPAKKPPEGDPAVERGERLATGKAIARGGNRTGQVPGATEQRS
jgi:hypothetical protein